MSDFYLKKGDLLPILSVEVKDYSGSVIDLSGCTVAFNYRLRSGEDITTRVAVVEDAAAGVVQYEWESDDTATEGVYVGEFVVTFSSGKQLTFPQDTTLVYEIVSDIS
jgi:hypothetical protein